MTDVGPPVVSGGVAAVSVAITAWLEDEQERQGFNIPDDYLTWFDPDELAAALVSVMREFSQPPPS